jgi:hypothetical protein
MEDVRQIAVADYKQVQENGPDVCDSESHSEHSDHGEDIPVNNMYTSELVGVDGKPKGPQMLTPTQAVALRATARSAREAAKPTIQAESQPPARSEPTIQASPEQSRPLVSLGPSAEVSPKKTSKKRKPSARPGRSISVDSEQGMAGGLGTAKSPRSTDTSVAHGHSSQTRQGSGSIYTRVARGHPSIPDPSLSSSFFSKQFNDGTTAQDEQGVKDLRGRGLATKRAQCPTALVRLSSEANHHSGA